MGICRYPAIQAGYSPRSAAQTVHRMIQKPSAQADLEDLRTKSRTDTIKTAVEVKEGISRLLDKAEKAEDYGGYTQLANRLAKMEGHDAVEKIEVGVQGRVMLVPMAQDLAEWESHAIESQAKLMADTLDI